LFALQFFLRRHWGGFGHPPGYVFESLVADRSVSVPIILSESDRQDTRSPVCLADLHPLVPFDQQRRNSAGVTRCTWGGALYTGSSTSTTQKAGLSTPQFWGTPGYAHTI